MKQTPPTNVHNQTILEIIENYKYDKVIEVGCMHGALAAKYIEKNPLVNWVGIDIDPEYIEIAKKKIKNAFCADIEKVSEMEFEYLAKADLWIFADVLEHLYNPWNLLKKIRDTSLNVEVIACIPNSQHWSFQARVNSGDWQYESHGLFDKTHIRFFSQKTMTHLFESSGYEIINITPRIFNFPDQEKYDKCIFEFAKVSGINAIDAVQKSKVFQYVYHVKKI
jgi:ubiquinone/menaquinone biosynthesis C-methylase UbiE